MKNPDDRLGMVSIGGVLEEVKGSLSFNVSDEKLLEVATEVYKSQMITLGLQDIAESIRESSRINGSANNKRLTELFAEFLEEVNSFGLKVKVDQK